MKTEYLMSYIYSTENRIKELQDLLVDVNEDATYCVPLHPLYANTGLTVDKLYTEVVIRNDLTNIQQSNISEHEHRFQTKNVTSPEDIFTKDGKPARNVYMIGKPGHGKTTYCLHLLKLWCAAISVISNTTVSIGKNAMKMFHFVFYISLLHVEKCRYSVMDMICEDIFDRDYGNRDVIRYVLGNPEYRCLVILDGLDEWILSPEARTKLRSEGIPNTGGLSKSCTILFASRPWKMELIQPKYSKKDVVVEIMGVSREGVKIIIQNILTNFFKLTIDDPGYTSKFYDLEKMAREKRMSRFEYRIPLLVSMTVFLGYDKTYVQDSMTGVIVDQLEILIRLSMDRGQIETNITNKRDMKINVPQNIKENKLLSRFIVLFHKLGKLAYSDLISKESHLVFTKEMLEDTLGENELDMALKIGIVSQTRVPGRFRVPKVSVQFLHKTMQEALAAFYIVCDTADIFTSFCEHCNSIDTIMDMSNVLVFMAGFSPLLGCKFSRHIVNIASTDKELMEEREDMTLMKFGSRARMLYNVHCECFKEIGHSLDLKGSATSNLAIQYHISDAIVWPGDWIEVVRDKVSICSESLVSFGVEAFGTAWCKGRLPIVLRRLRNLTTLVMVHANYTPIENFIGVMPCLTSLQRVMYYHNCISYVDQKCCSKPDSEIVRSILGVVTLKHVRLELIRLEDDSLLFTNAMPQLQKVELCGIHMSAKAWNTFVKSYVCLKHPAQIFVRKSNIDKDTFSFISGSKCFNVTEKEDDDKSEKTICFSTVPMLPISY